MKIRSPYIVNEFKLENPILRLRNNFVVPLSREKMRCTFSPIIQNRFKFSSTTHAPMSISIGSTYNAERSFHKNSCFSERYKQRMFQDNTLTKQTLRRQIKTLKIRQMSCK